jgi:RNA polymerase sigma factor (sigma-70 family)
MAVVTGASVREDSELLAAWSSGDRQAGELLFDRHFVAVTRFFRNKVGPEIDDLIQKTFLACVESKSQYRGEASFRAFLFGVARNVLHKHYRERDRALARFDRLETSVHDLGPSPSVIRARTEEQHLLLNALRRVPIDHQIALELHYWEALSSGDIAEVLGVPLGTAKTRIRRAKQLLGQEIEALQTGATELQHTETQLEGWATELRARLLD